MANKGAKLLTLQQRIHLADLLRRHAVRYQQDRPLYEKVAEELSAEIGAAISPVTVKSTAKALGVAWKAKRVVVNRPARGPALARVDLLERVVASLLTELGRELPPEWVSGGPKVQPAANGRHDDDRVDPPVLRQR